MNDRTYADHVVDYAQAGWPCILPVPPATKTPPPTGFTGAEGRDTDPVQLVQWATSPQFAGYSIALRMPETVIGIDVDEYVKGEVTKHGANTLAAAIAAWGPLPATWTSTARAADGPSRIYFFRVPAQRYATKIAFNIDGVGTGDVEVIQRHHRYAVVWPSDHKDAGTYTWYDPQGHASDHPPKPDEFPELPQAWVNALAAGATDQGPASADHASGQVLLDQLVDDWRPECAEITSARLLAHDELAKADAGSRHDTMTGRIHHLVQLAAAGHTGVAAALLELRQAWAAITAGEERGDELERMLLTSARKAVTVVGAHQVVRDPCLMAQGMPIPAPAPGGPADDPDAAPDPEAEAIEPARWYSAREFIGTAAFDPNAGLDQSLAEKVLERTWPVVRYAYDSHGWLLRVPDRWELHNKLSGWAVAQVATLMPLGDPTAEKGSEQAARAARRTRLMSTAGARAVSGKMEDLVAGGTHPASLRLAGLDADPEILWAGGLAYDLRACAAGPVVAAIDPSTPHLHAAGTTPAVRDTPLWDELLAAIWPDEAVRAWAVRVLSVAVTGYADRALPILLGETGRGKTQLVALLMSVLGSYAHAADSRLLSEAGEKAHASIVFALKGRRLSFIDEGPREGRWAQERLKQLTGGGELTANQMNQNPITFRPTHTLVLTANDEPILTDPAVRSRTRLIPCEGDPDEVRRTRAAIGHVSSPQWRREAPGVLAKMMAEAAGWLADPMTAHVTAAPEHIRYLAENVGAEQDPILVWVTEETEPFEIGTPSRELYQAFVASCRRNSMRADAIPTETKWGRAMTRLGYLPVHTEHGKRRQLQVRSGGFLPGMTPPPVTGVHRTADGFDGNPDGLLTGSDPNPSGVNPQVNPRESVDPDGSDGLENLFTRTCAPAPAQGSQPLKPVNPSGDPSANRPKTAPDLGKQPPDGLEEPQSSAQPTVKVKRERSAAATQRAAEKRAEARAAAIAEAAGEHVELPALVTRDGAVVAAGLADVDALLATISSAEAGELTVDVETTGFPVGHRDYAMRTVQLGGATFAAVLDPDDADQADVVRRHLAAAPVLHAHSATADLVPLADAGLLDLEDAWGRMHDTVVYAKLADPASTGSDPGLKKLARAMLGDQAVSPAADDARAALFKAGKWLTETKVTTPAEKSGWGQVDPSCTTMARYAASDVLDDAAIATRLPKPPAEILDRERTAQRMTARVAHTGLRIDGEHTLDLLGQHQGARQACAEIVQRFAVENPGSNVQVGEALGALGVALPRTATGKPSVREAVLTPLRHLEGPAGELASAVLDYRHHDTAIGLFLEPYLQLVAHGDGRARPTVYTLSADTGRMSCVRPNLQQVPREGGFRSCITADPGHLLVSADFAGVELRVAAALSGDRNLRAILGDPERDLHWEIARLAFGPGATKANRYAVKRGVFGRIYGGGVAAIAAGVGVSEATAQAIIDALDTLLPELSEWSRMVRRSVESGHTQFPTYAGRVVYLDQQMPHKAPNYCIQGTARELLVDALIRWADTPWGGATLLPVHDELVVMVPEDQAADATTALTDVMTSELNGIPIIAEASEPSYAWKDSA